MVEPVALAAGLLLGAYLLGAIPFAYLVGRWRLGVDISREGSGTIGASNLARHSLPLGGLVLLLDGAKGWVPAALGLHLGGLWFGAALGLAAACGHCWSVYRWHAARKGGKGVATLLGALLALAPALLPLFGLAFVVTTWLTGYRALGTILAAALALPALVLVGAPPALTAFGAAGLILLLATHRDNLRRIRAGTEERGFFPRR